MTGVAGSSAVRMSVTASSSSYSTATSSAASSATARLVATMAATASPCQQTRSIAMACCGADLRPFKCESTPTQGVMTAASSFAGHDGDDSGQALCLGGIDTDDFRMGMRRAQEHHMRHARQFHVADIKPASLHQPLEIGPRHGLADIGIRPVEHREAFCICRRDAHGLRPMRALRGGLDRIDDGLIAGAAAVIAGKMFAYLRPIRLGLLLQQILRGHQHARRAEAALQRIAIAKRRLQIGDLAAVGQSLDGLDGGAVRLHRQHQAGAHDLAIDAHRAGAANPMLAADMRSRQLQMLAQEIRQIKPRQNLRLDALAIDLKRDGHMDRQADPPALRSGRPSSADTHRASSTFARCRRIATEAC